MKSGSVITGVKNTDKYFPFIGLSCVNDVENPFKVWDKVKKDPSNKTIQI